MDEQDLSQLLIRTFSGCDGFEVDGVQKLATELASSSGVVASLAGAKAAASAPDEKQKACYAKCEQERDAALFTAAKLGWPAGSIAAAAAVMQFNACRHSCDQ
jgi:hypothetical protein